MIALRVLADLASVLVGFGASYLVYRALVMSGVWVWDQPPELFPYVRVALMYAAITVIVFRHLGLYQRRASVLNLWQLKAAVGGMAVSGAFFFTLLFFLKLEHFSRAMMLCSMGLGVVCVVIQRRWTLSIFQRVQLRGSLGWRTLIYGCGETGQLVMKKIVQGAHLHSLVVGFVDDEAPIGSTLSCRITQTGSTLFRAPVLGRFADLPDIITALSVNEVLVTTTTSHPRLAEITAACRTRGVEIGVVPHLGSGRADQFVVEDLSAIPVLRSRIRSSQPLFLLAKRAFDILGASLAALMTLPMWCLAALAIKIDSPGPVIFAQARVGLNGQRFRMYKFRTMRHDTAPFAFSPVGDIDPRITRVGRLLRVGGIDELPQLWNVLRGDMSLVGPRPEMPFIVESYNDVERERLKATPGVTGLWQISPDRHAQIHDNIEYDLYYVDHRSFVLDMLILIETVLLTGATLLGVVMRLGRPPVPAGATIGSAPEAVPGRAATAPRLPGGYVLVALDQRRHDGRWPDSWVECLPAACDLAHRWDIKVLAAPDNRSALSAIVEDQFGDVKGGRIEYVSYRGPEDVRSLLRHAQLVVTDLTHVAEQARQCEVDVLSLDGSDGAVEAPAAHVLAVFLDRLAQRRASGGSIDVRRLMETT